MMGKSIKDTKSKYFYYPILLELNLERGITCLVRAENDGTEPRLVQLRMRLKKG